MNNKSRMVVIDLGAFGNKKATLLGVGPFARARATRTTVREIVAPVGENAPAMPEGGVVPIGEPIIDVPPPAPRIERGDFVDEEETREVPPIEVEDTGIYELGPRIAPGLRDHVAR